MYVAVFVCLPLNKLCWSSHLSTNILSPILFSIEKDERKSTTSFALVSSSPLNTNFFSLLIKNVHGVTPWLIIRAYTNTKDWITDGVLDLNTFNTISWRISLCFLPNTLSKRITAKLPAYIDADSKDFSLGILRSNLTSCTTISVNLAFLAKRC